MIKEAIGVAETVEEAKEKALLELDVSFDDEVQVEVLELPKKKALGLFGGSAAKVKVSVEVPDPKPARAPKQSKPSKKAEKVEAKKTEETVEEVKQIPAAEVDKESPVGKAVTYLQSILDKLGCDGISVTVCDIEGGSQITLTGDGLGVVIGRRGETLDALQYLVSLAANAGVSGYYRVVLNTGDFRQKREQTLIALAKRMSEQAIKSGKCRTLEPMNPYERRIIHTAVQKVNGAISWSEGENANRHVVIGPDPNSKTKPYNKGGYNRGRGGKRPYNSNRPSAKTSAPVNPDRKPLNEGGTTGLYGRIDK